MSPKSSATTPNVARLRETAHRQFRSVLFGRLPREIREMIYIECWKASGIKQHVFIRNGRLTHSPCLLASDETDERLEELQRVLHKQGSPQRWRTRSLALDNKWAGRFSSSWHEHWICEEEMKEVTANHGETHHCHQRTIFLPMMLACKRTYLEARPSLYATTTLIFTDLAAAHACLALSPSTTASLLHSLAFSLVLPFETLHQHRLRPSPATAGPWAALCTALSDLVRFANLRDVTMRLGLASSSATHYVDRHAGKSSSSGKYGSGSGSEGEDSEDGARINARIVETRPWQEVRERWALSAVRGMLARRLVLQLPRAEPTRRRPEWVTPYNYPEEDCEGKSGGVPFLRLERYAALPPMQFREDGRVEARVDARRERSGTTVFSISLAEDEGRGEGDRDGDRDEGGMRETRLRKVRRGVKGLMTGLKVS
ncbi:hypothetical protein GGS26DRAFT_51116 [Hypomontagnella submonticulosa]|nr:hypothetical protein GGS26DRAFT_51116 [Hypomontagnella submonticulosa]